MTSPAALLDTIKGSQFVLHVVGKATWTCGREGTPGASKRPDLKVRNKGRGTAEQREETLTSPRATDRIAHPGDVCLYYALSPSKCCLMTKVTSHQKGGGLSLMCACSTVSLKITLGATRGFGMGDRTAAFPTCFQYWLPELKAQPQQKYTPLRKRPPHPRQRAPPP